MNYNEYFILQNMGWSGTATHNSSNFRLLKNHDERHQFSATVLWFVWNQGITCDKYSFQIHNLDINVERISSFII